MGIDLEKLEGKLDKAVAGATAISMSMGGVQFQSMMELMEFARLMALSGLAVPYHLRGNPGACLAICTRALRFGFDPFALAEHSFSMKKDVETTVENQNGGRSTVKVPVETIAYDSYVIRAVIEAHAPIKGRLRYAYDGDGDGRTCTVSAKLLDGGEIVSHTSPTLGERKKAIGTSDKGNLKGSPLWLAKPDVQIGYDTARDLCRLHFPEVLMGWYDKDEMDEMERANTAQNITPTVGDRLREQKAKSSEGFAPAKITQQMSEVVPDKVGAHREKVSVEVGGSVVTPTQATARPAEPSPDEPRAASVASTNTQADRQSPPEPPRESDDEAMHVLQEAQSGTVAGAEPAKVAKPKREPKPKAAKAETALERGTRLLPAQATKQAVEELQSSIAEELGSAESEQWIALCEARIGELKP